MLLKRELTSGRVTGIRLLRAGRIGTRQHFTPRLIHRGLTEGWLEIQRSRLILQATGGAVIYQILREPGYYCCHCQDGQPDAVGARQHVEAKHGGHASPDRQNPSGYRLALYYDCRRVE